MTTQTPQARRCQDHRVELSRVQFSKPRVQVPADRAKTLLATPAPREPVSPDDILQRFQEQIEPYPFGNGHPRFWGWVNSPPAVMGIVFSAFSWTYAAAQIPGGILLDRLGTRHLEYALSGRRRSGPHRRRCPAAEAEMGVRVPGRSAVVLAGHARRRPPLRRKLGRQGLLARC